MGGTFSRLKIKAYNYTKYNHLKVVCPSPSAKIKNTRPSPLLRKLFDEHSSNPVQNKLSCQAMVNLTSSTAGLFAFGKRQTWILPVENVLKII